MISGERGKGFQVSGDATSDNGQRTSGCYNQVMPKSDLGPRSFNLSSDYEPRGDQVTAIQELVRGVEEGKPHQVLLGVTGSGKTFTVAKVIEAVNRPP